MIATADLRETVPCDLGRFRASSRGSQRPADHPAALPALCLAPLEDAPRRLRFRPYRRAMKPNTATPTVSITNNESAILNSRLALTSGHIVLARASSTRNHLFAGTLATDSPLADSQRPLRRRQPTLQVGCIKVREIPRCR